MTRKNKHSKLAAGYTEYNCTAGRVNYLLKHYIKTDWKEIQETYYSLLEEAESHFKTNQN